MQTDLKNWYITSAALSTNTTVSIAFTTVTTGLRRMLSTAAATEVELTAQVAYYADLAAAQSAIATNVGNSRESLTASMAGSGFASLSTVTVLSSPTVEVATISVVDPDAPLDAAASGGTAVIIVVIVLLIVLLGGGGGFFMYKRSQSKKVFAA